MTREEAVYQINQLAVLSTNKEIPKITEALEMAIKALHGDMYCPNCGVRLVPENEYLEPTQTHGRLIDASALGMDTIRDKLCKDIVCIRCPFYRNLRCDVREIINNAPTVQADRPHGEWVEREDWNGDSYYDCSVCGESFVLYDGTPSMNLYHFCPNCGADMRKEKK